LRHQFINYVCTADRNQERVEEERQQTEEKTKKVGLNNAYERGARGARIQLRTSCDKNSVNEQ